METYFPEDSVFSRAKNFCWNLAPLEKLYFEERNSFLDFEILKNVVISYCENSFVKELNPLERLEHVLRKIYDVMKKSELAFHLFCGESRLADYAYEAYVFTACSAFLHTSKREKAMTISEFVKKNHPLDFKNRNSPNYWNPSLFQSEVERLRKARQRRLNQGAGYYKENSQWNAMAKDSEYEWTRYYTLETIDAVIRDTNKRVGNLYKGIPEAIAAARDDKYNGGVQLAYKKFLSKLKKVKYKDFLSLYKTDFSRICENKEYYGLNLYRLERRLQPYKIMYEVKKLTRCCSSEEEADLLLKMICLDEICFPKIYEALLHTPLDLIAQYTEEYLQMWITDTIISNLILDELVEKNFFGENWCALFLDKVNEMAEEVLYNPQTVEFFEEEYAQEKFVRLLHAGVFLEVCVACNSEFHATDLLI